VIRERDVQAVIERRQLGIDASNHVWTLMDKPDRTREEDDLGLHEIHASADRANPVAGDADAAGRHDSQARQLGKRIAEDHDRKHVSAELETLPL
jgi:hypothetical protein